MAELERALLLVGNDVDVPPTPMWMARVVAERIGRRRRQRRIAVIAFAAVLAALAVAFVVPQARSAILRLFHIGAVTVERVKTLPNASTQGLTAGLGSAHTRADAEKVAGFHARLGSVNAPTPWYAREHFLATILPSHVLLVEIAGDQAGLIKKLSGARAYPTDVNGAFALWIPGRHVLIYDRGLGNLERVARYSGSALIWERGAITYRLEGEPSRDAALRDARKITP